MVENDTNFGLLHHVEIYVDNLRQSLDFWQWFLQELGYQEYQKWPKGCSYKRGVTYIVFVEAEEKYRTPPYHRKRAGLNHLAFHGGSRRDIDDMVEKLQARNISLLYGGPICSGDSYCIYFEDPQRIKVELCGCL